jgi:hypothetical protein
MTFLIPLVVGAVIMGIVCWKELPKHAQMNRSLAAGAMLVGSLLWWLSSAILLLRHHRYYGSLNVLCVFIFAIGIAFLLPAPATTRNPNKQSALASAIVVAGVLLGFAHALAIGFTTWWPQTLLVFYARLGI